MFGIKQRRIFASVLAFLCFQFMTCQFNPSYSNQISESADVYD